MELILGQNSHRSPGFKKKLMISTFHWSKMNFGDSKNFKSQKHSIVMGINNPNRIKLPSPLSATFLFPFFIFLPLGARWGQLYSIGTDYLVLRIFRDSRSLKRITETSYQPGFKDRTYNRLNEKVQFKPGQEDFINYFWSN